MSTLTDLVDRFTGLSKDLSGLQDAVRRLNGTDNEVLELVRQLNEQLAEVRVDVANLKVKAGL